MLFYPSNHSGNLSYHYFKVERLYILGTQFLCISDSRDRAVIPQEALRRSLCNGDRLFSVR